MRETPIVVRPVWLTSAPLRLLPIRLTAEPLATLDSAVVPAVPRTTLNVVALVGSPLIWTYSVFPVAESTS